MNLKFTYFYRDSFDSKTYHSVMYSNIEKLTLKQIRTYLKMKLIKGKYFYPEGVGLPVFFAPMSALYDHPPYHEFSGVEKVNHKSDDSFEDIIILLEKLY